MRFILTLLLTLSCYAQAAEPELLEPDKAFRFSARVKDPGSIEVSYQIAPGYYLYRDKFQFALAPAEAKAGAPQMPVGKKHKDEFFGEVETYRGSLTIVLPYSTSGAALPAATLTATSQGCADVGVCYVPHQQKAVLKLAPASPAQARSDPPASPFG